MQSKATTVEQYIAELPPERREAITRLREIFLRNLGKGYREGMAYGMISYAVPHEIYPPGYHCDPKMPLGFAGIASQKNHLSVYIMSLYGPDSDEAWFRDAWEATGKKLDMGKCCVRFRRLDDAALDVIGEAIRRWPVDRWIRYYEAGLAQAERDRVARRAAKGTQAAGAGARARAGRGGVSGGKRPAAPRGPSKAPSTRSTGATKARGKRNATKPSAGKPAPKGAARA